MKQAKKTDVYLWGLFILIFCLGVFLRFKGIYSQVSYIDELLLLSRGELSFTDSAISPIPFWRYVYKTVSSFTNSYAPVQIFLGRLITGEKMFSFHGLKVLRTLSCVFSCLSLLLFGRLIYVYSGRRITAPLIFIFTIFCCQMIQWVNAKQGHTYSAGVFGVLLTLWLFEGVILFRTSVYHLLFLFGAIFSGLIQYQVLLCTLSVSLVGLIYLKGNLKNGVSRSLGGALLVLFGFSVCSIFFLSVYKGHMMVPYWVHSFMAPETGVLLRFKMVAYKLVRVFVLAHLTYPMGESLILGLVGMFLSLLGAFIIVLPYSLTGQRVSLGLRASFLFLVIWTGAFLVRKTVISPTRHSMVYLPSILFLELLGLKLIASRLSKFKVQYIFYLSSLAIISLTVLNFPNYLNSSRETYSSSKIKELMDSFNVRDLVSWRFDSLKLRLFSPINSGCFVMDFHWGGDLNSLPSRPLLFIEGNSSGELLSLEEFKRTSKFVGQKVYEASSNYDFEPMSAVHYGKNLFKVWLLTPKK